MFSVRDLYRILCYIKKNEIKYEHESNFIPISNKTYSSSTAHRSKNQFMHAPHKYKKKKKRLRCKSVYQKY